MLQIVYGRSRRGKSSYLVDRIGKDLRNGGDNIIYMVPDQFTLEAERLLIGRLQLPGLFQIQVLSFRRLIHMLQSELGGSGQTELDLPGKAILTNQALFDLNPELTLYQDTYKNSTFAFALSAMITECKQFGIEPGYFAGDKPPGKLGRKLQDIGTIYAAYQSCQQEFVDHEQVIDRVIQQATTSKLIQGAKIYVDSFDVFTQQAYDLIEQMNRVADITIALCTDLKNEALFALPNQTYQKLGALEGKKAEPVNLNANQFVKNNIGHLERFLLEEVTRQQAPDGSVELFAFDGILGEVEQVTAAILEKNRSGIAFREMAVICNDLPGYGRLCTQVFADNGIPSYLDQKYNLLSSGFGQFLVNLLRTCAHPDRACYLAMIKAGYFDLLDREIEEYENYVLEFGFARVVLKNAELRQSPVQQYNLETIDKAKKAASFQSLQRKLRKSQTCGEMSAALHGYLALLDILPDNQLEEDFYRGATNILETLGKVMKERPVELPLFIDLLETGLESVEVGTLPQHMDEVVIGDVSRSKLHPVKAVFVLGANDQLLPKTTKQDSLLTDSDRQYLKAREQPIGRDNADLAALERLLTYKLLAQPKDYLWISCPRRSLRGEELEQSPLFERILELLPGLRVVSQSRCRQQTDRMLLYSKQVLYKRLLCALRQQEDTPFWRGVYDYFYRTRPEQLQQALREKDYNLEIPPDQARALYGNARVSPTRLETYYSCPFRQFVRYGLQPLVRPIYRIDKLGTGEMLHRILEEFSKRMMSEGKLEEDRAMALVEQVADELLPQYHDGIYENSNANRTMELRVRNITKQAVRNMLRHLQEDGFDLYKSELPFGSQGIPPIRLELEGGEVVELTGKIDRVDVSEGGVLRVIDYKSGAKKLDFRDIYYGLKLQLLLYLNAALDHARADKGEELLPGGMYYMKLNLSCKTQKSKRDLVQNAQEILAQMLDVSQISLQEVEVKKGNASREEMQAILQYGERQTKRAVQKIYEGDVKIRPKKHPQYDPCTHCDYLTICKRGQDAYQYLPKKEISDIQGELE